MTAAERCVEDVRSAVAALRDGETLARALEISRPSEVVFEEALLSAKRELLRARTHLTEGFDGSQELLGISGSIADLAYDMYEEMERKTNPRKRRRVWREE